MERATEGQEEGRNGFLDGFWPAGEGRSRRLEGRDGPWQGLLASPQAGIALQMPSEWPRMPAGAMKWRGMDVHYGRREPLQKALEAVQRAEGMQSGRRTPIAMPERAHLRVDTQVPCRVLFFRRKHISCVEAYYTQKQGVQRQLDSLQSYLTINRSPFPPASWHGNSLWRIV